MRVCSIEGCGRPHEARGWCRPHYWRWSVYGDPLGSSLPREPWQHGSFTGYNNHGCRCDLCRAAGSAYQSQYRVKNRGVCSRCGGPTGSRFDGSLHCQACDNLLREAPHGSESRARRCHCEICRAGAAAARRERRQRAGSR